MTKVLLEGADALLIGNVVDNENLEGNAKRRLFVNFTVKRVVDLCAMLFARQVAKDVPVPR